MAEWYFPNSTALERWKLPPDLMLKGGFPGPPINMEQHTLLGCTQPP